MDRKSDILSLATLTDEDMAISTPIMHKVFANWSAYDPDRVALVYGVSQLSYMGLHEKANQLAEYLTKKGVTAKARVGLWIEPCFERIIGLLAILKCGAVVCPIDPAVPTSLLNKLLANIDAACLLSSTQKLAKENEQVEVKECFTLDTLMSELDAPVSVDHGMRELGDSVINEGDLAYIIHTSGSTGLPKAVAMSHRALSYEIRWQIKQSSKSQPRTLQLASLGFDVFLTESLSTLVNGGTLVLASDAMRKEPATLLTYIIQQNIERLLISRVLLQRLVEEACKKKIFPIALTEIMSTGEQLVVTEEIRQFFTQLSSCLFYNEYGMSENPVVTTYVLQGNTDTWPEFPPIGRPAADTQVYLLDESLQTVVMGEEGEICITSNYLAEGYLNNTEHNDKFIPNPFGAGQMFRTGDIGRYSAKDQITLVGRKDGIVKIRGVRVGLGEVEETLKQHSLVTDAVVIKDKESQEDRLIAYVVLTNLKQGFETVLREYIQAHVSAYAVPAFFVSMAEIPLTYSGKINRLALPKIGERRPELSTVFVSANTSLEKQLVLIWQKVLKLDRVGVRDNIFDVGGNSLSIATIVREIKHSTGIELEATALFEYPSIAALTRHMTRCSQAGGSQQEDINKPGFSDSADDTTQDSSVSERRRNRRRMYRSNLKEENM